MEASIFRIPLPDDYEGSVAATLVRFAAGRAPSRAVLYLHGYVDYFFQTHMARWFVARGWSFYALDLRKYGRSLEAGQTPYYCRDLHEYYPEIDRSIERMRQDRIERIVLMGHSTGGLLASLYASDGRRRADIERLILNSPFFEFNASWFKRRVAVPVAAVLGRLWPYAHKKNELSPFYFDSVYRGRAGNGISTRSGNRATAYRSISFGSARSARRSDDCGAVSDCVFPYSFFLRRIRVAPKHGTIASVRPMPC